MEGVVTVGAAVVVEVGWVLAVVDWVAGLAAVVTDTTVVGARVAAVLEGPFTTSRGCALLTACS